MSQISRVVLHISKKLRDPDYRHRFFRGITQDEVAAQIREWRVKRNLRQVDLAKQCGMKQSAVSRLEQAEYSGWTFNTLMRIADALDVRIHFVFEAAESAIAEFERVEKATDDAPPSADDSFLTLLKSVRTTQTEKASGLEKALQESSTREIGSLRPKQPLRSQPSFPSQGSQRGRLEELSSWN